MKIVAVMVTYNRLGLLKQSLETYENQQHKPSVMIVVDNCSTDGTYEFLESWKENEAPFEKIVIHTDSNLGGSGGFYIGLKKAIETDCEWCWIADDDAFLERTTLDNIQKVYYENEEVRNAVALCSTVVEDQKSGKISVVHRKKMNTSSFVPKISSIQEDIYAGGGEYFPIDLFTYVGSLVRLSTLCDVGLPKKEYFIYFDDLEHAYRFREKGKIYCILSSKVYHNAAAHENPRDISWRNYYRFRNRMDFLKCHFKYGYYIECLKTYCKFFVCGILRNNLTRRKMEIDALNAVKNNRLGIDTKYFIGWKPENTRR